MANEKRLIDANALQKRMFDYYGCVNEHTSKSTYTGDTLMDYEVAGMIEDCIENAPTVNAVEVVRCKDCDHGSHVDTPEGRVWCEKMCRYMVYEGYCSYGKRK